MVMGSGVPAGAGDLMICSRPSSRPFLSKRNYRRRVWRRADDPTGHIYDLTQKGMGCGVSWQTLLDPPPAVPRVAHSTVKGWVAITRKVDG